MIGSWRPSRQHRTRIGAIWKAYRRADKTAVKECTGMDRQPAGLGRMACHGCALRRDVIALGRGVSQRAGLRYADASTSVRRRTQRQHDGLAVAGAKQLGLDAVDRAQCLFADDLVETAQASHIAAVQQHDGVGMS